MKFFLLLFTDLPVEKNSLNKVKNWRHKLYPFDIKTANEQRWWWWRRQECWNESEKKKKNEKKNEKRITTLKMKERKKLKGRSKEKLIQIK